ncbi:chemerin-like receptor 1 [Leptodactylus fuscus]|uniref:chemerin-like receptor 1 n=1 Tax=Leptodactylus fuscus TaxID=238119 RepID=UPI003F4E83A4
MADVMEDVRRVPPTSGIILLDITSANTTKPSPNYYDFSPLTYFSLVVFTLAFLLGTTGNGLVIWLTTFRMKKTVNVIRFLNLAISDFAFTLFLPFNIFYIINGSHWIFGKFLCKFNSTLAYLNVFASVFLLTAISMDRFVSVIFPVWCQNHRTPTLALVIVVVIWILSVLCSSPYYVIRDTFEKFGSTRCYDNFKLGGTEDGGRSLHEGIVTLRFLIAFVIPFTIIVACYTVIALRIHRNRMTTSSKPFKVIVAVIVCFFICWVPYHIFSFLELYSTYREDGTMDDLYYGTRVGFPLSIGLAFMNGAINPFLYVFIGRDFKANFWRSIQSILEKAFNEDSMNKELRSRSKSMCESQLL